MKKEWALCAFGLMLLATADPLAADVLGRKTMERRYETSGFWCQIPFSDHPDLGDPRIGTINDLFVFTAVSPTVTIVVEADNRKEHNSNIDNIVLAKSTAFDRQENWGEAGCFSDVPAFFDFTRLASNDPDLVFSDTFVDGPHPDWSGLSPIGAHWSFDSSETPFIPVSSGQINGSLGLNVLNGPPTVKTSITLTNLIPGEEYGLSFWWRVSIADAGTPPTISVAAHDTPQLTDGQPWQDSIMGTSPLDTWDYFYIDIPQGTPRLSVDLSPFGGDVDLYVRHGELPDIDNYTCRSIDWFTQNEHCEIQAPAPGRWWIGVANFSTGNPIDYTLRAEWQDSGLEFYTLPPCRILDTRTPPGIPLDSGWIDFVIFAGRCGIPNTAKAVSANITVAGATGSGNLKLWPGNATEPLASNINFVAGMTRANNALLGLATDGWGDCAVKPFIAGNGTVHLIVDVSGYFE